MTIFKCKMCEGSLEITNETVAVCEYCRTVQTIPRLTDEKRVNLYDRANHFRRNNEYDKALSIYEQILLEDKTDAEAYWSILLCIYGIEYVEDPATHRRIPTVNRVQLTSILDDENYKATLKYSDSKQKKVYEQEAREINRIQKEILEISENEEPYDVFICYKETDANGERTEDSVLAQDIYTQLEQEGIRVFFSKISLEDKLGSAYEPYIFAAINSAKVMIVVGTKQEHFNAVWVKNEWSRYLAHVKNGENKTIIPAYKDMSPYDLPVEFSHLQSQDMSKIGFMQDLVRGVKKLLSEDKGVNSKKVAMDEKSFEQLQKKYQKLMYKKIIIIVIIFAVLFAGAIFYRNGIESTVKYIQAYFVMKSGNYEKAYELFKNNIIFDSQDKAWELCFELQKDGLKDIKTGQIVNFGIYEQDGQESTDWEEISWVVIEKEEDKVLLASKSILEYMPFHYKNEDVSWENSDLRAWLNSEFYDEAFGRCHKEIILNEPSLSESGKILCYDNVQIAIQTRIDYFSEVQPSPYVLKKGETNNSYWSRRASKSEYPNNEYGIYVKNVLYATGTNVQQNRGVRPFIWVSIETEK